MINDKVDMKHFMNNIMREYPNMIVRCVECSHTIEIRDTEMITNPLPAGARWGSSTCAVSYTTCAKCKGRIEIGFPTRLDGGTRISCSFDQLLKISNELSYRFVYPLRPLHAHIYEIASYLKNITQMNYVNVNVKSDGETVESAERMPYMRPGFFM